GEDDGPPRRGARQRGLQVGAAPGNTRGRRRQHARRREGCRAPVPRVVGRVPEDGQTYELADAGAASARRAALQSGRTGDAMPAPRRSSLSLSAKTAELAFAVPQVVAHRLLRMAHAGPHLSARARKEFARMIAEKHSAFGESWNAMAVQSLASQRAFAAALALAATP